jgi:hypothetical protein
MKTFRTIIIILGILVAGAAFNTTFAQAKAEKEMLYASRHDYSKIKHKADKADKEKNKAYKEHAKADHKGDKHKIRGHKHADKSAKMHVHKHKAITCRNAESKMPIGKLE